jgi:hypothetical protein
VKITTEIELTESEVKEALQDYVNKKSSKKEKFTDVGHLKFLNGKCDEKVLFTQIKFNVDLNIA